MATLYYTPNSPYARMVRVALREGGLMDGVEEVEAKTRAENTWFFDVTPLARVPTWVEGDMVLAETREICAHLNGLSAQLDLFPAEDDAARLMRHVSAGFLDGVCVWLRENGRDPEGQSPKVMAYEAHRAARVLAWLEPLWHDAAPLSYSGLCLACAIDIAQSRGMAEGWQEIAPRLMAWAEEIAQRPAMRATAPLPI